MAIQIQFRRGTSTEWASVNPILALAEMGIETDTNLFKIGNGVDRWNDLDYGGLRGFTGSSGFAGSIGNIAVENVLYVSKSGSDLNDGTSLSTSKLTIRSALAAATTGTTIFVKSGDYIENNPLTVPDFVSIIGDNLRSVTVRPQNITQDLFYVNNGVYLAHMTFKDHEAPAAAVAFNPDGSAGVIFTSPYVQNCTSMTTTGTGMRVDGDHAEGTKSMVVDAYTQYNQGGIGIHMLNRGYTQLVSVFTICCDIAILCESGGSCSVTNSNSSFGNYGLKSDGVSSVLYTGKVRTATTVNSRVVVIDNLTTKPAVGNAVYFASDSTGTYFTVESSTEFTPGGVTIVYPNFSNENSDLRNARNTILDNKSKIQIETIDYINETFPGFEYNQFKCTRDIGYIIDAVVDDMVLNTNYRTILAGTAYYRSTSNVVTATQKTETIAAINFVKTKALLSIVSNFNTGTNSYDRVAANFNTVINILSSGTSVVPVVEFNNPGTVDTNRIRAKSLLQANKQFLIEEGAAYISSEYPDLIYDQIKCKRDMGYIIDAVTYDVLYQGNSQTADAADEYYSAGTLQISSNELQPTIDTFAFLKILAQDVVKNVSINPLNGIVSQITNLGAATQTEADIIGDLFNIVTELLANGYSSTVTLEETHPPLSADTVVRFQEFSLITSSGHTFEWVGAGTNINTSLPSLGGNPVVENQVVTVNGGQVYFTSTDEKGDFRIGNDFVINRKTGTITGRTFTKSLFAVMTPYILAIGR